MKNLKELKEQLKSQVKGYQELSNQEKKNIFGGQYLTEEECKEDCGAWTTSYGPSGSSFCFPIQNAYPQIWDCMDS